MPRPPLAPFEDAKFLGPADGVARLIAALDGSATPLGPLHDWPRSLKTVVALMLRSPVAMAVLWGADGRMIYNDAYAVICAERHPAMLGSDVRASWPEAADFNAQVLKSVLAGESLTYRDLPFTLQRNGRPEVLWFQLDYSPLLGDDGEIAGVLAIVVETTQAVQAQQWLTSERERLRQMFEQAPGFMAMLIGREHRFDLVNPAYVQLVGHRDVIGMTVREALPEVAAQGFLRLLDDVFETGIAFSGTALPVMLQRTAGVAAEQRFVDFVYQPVRDPAGRVFGIFVQGVDVTDAVASRQQASATEARNRQILDSAVDYAIIAFDAAGLVTRWNEGAHRVLGWTEDEMLGENAARIFTPEDRAIGRMQTEMQRALTEGSGNDERWHLRQSGERFWASGELTPIRDDAGRVSGFVKVLRDRTEQHRAAEALKQSESRLRRAQEAGGVGTFTVDLSDNVVSATAEFYRIFGLEARGNVPAAVIEALVIEEDAHLRSAPDTRLSQTAALNVEYRIRRAGDGALRWIARKADYETDAEGRSVRMVGVVQDITDRVAAQRAIEDSAAQFRTFAQTLPNHVWTAPADGLLDWFNDRVYDYSGRSVGQLDGVQWTSIVHPEDLPEAARLWDESLASGLDYETEFRIRRADGHYRWHLVRAVPIRTSAGSVGRWVGTNTDIHQRKLAETQNARDRDRIWQLSQELMLVCDFTGLICAVNPAATRLLGWTEAEMVGATLADFVHPGDLARTAAEVVKLSDGAATLAFENRYRARDGSYLLLDWTAVPEAGLIHAVARNITGERAVAEERERIWSATNDLMGTARADGTLKSVNAAWRRLLGYDESELLGHPFAAIVDAEDVPKLDVVIDRIAEGHWLNQLEIRLVHKDGRRSLIAWNTEQVDDLLYIVGRNVTDQRAAEDALRQAQKMEAVGQLTGGIAHDFNNLLQGITGSLGLVQKRVAQGRIGEIDRLLTAAMSSAKRAAALTHRLLAFSRRQPLDPRPVEVNPLLLSMEDLLRRTLGERIRFQTALSDDLWLTQCDPNQLENAILNLAINSRDAMPDGGLLMIETCNAVFDSAAAAKLQGLQLGHYVCVGVSDTGTGMSADTMAKAFEPFFTTKPIGQGTGLGLSMIYGFARQSEGFAKIYSEVGRGTTFKLYLPQYRGDQAVEEPLPDLAPKDLARSNETVLVVEDEPIVRALIVEVLGELGYLALEAADGPSGLAVLQSKRTIDLLVTDIGLPGLNGRQIAEAGRELRPELKVLFMTGYAETAAIASGFLEPGMAMITKPFAMEALSQKIREILENP